MTKIKYPCYARTKITLTRGLEKGKLVCLIGELSNMSGHCICANEYGCFIGYHLDNFRILKEDET